MVVKTTIERKPPVSNKKIEVPTINTKEEKMERVRRDKKTIINDKLNSFFNGKVPDSIFKEEMEKINASLDILMENCISTRKKRKITAEDVLANFTLDDLIALKKEQENT